MFYLDNSETSWLVYADWLEDQDINATHIRESVVNPISNGWYWEDRWGITRVGGTTHNKVGGWGVHSVGGAGSENVGINCIDVYNNGLVGTGS